MNCQQAHLTSAVDAALVGAGGVGDDDEDLDDEDSPVNNIVVPNTLGADDEDDPIASLAVTAPTDPVQVLHHHQVSDLVSGGPGEDDDEGSGEQHTPGLEQTGSVVSGSL